MFESLAASPITTLGFIAMGASLFAIGCWLCWREGLRVGFERGVGTIVLNHVVREVIIDSENADEDFAETFREREWLQ